MPDILKQHMYAHYKGGLYFVQEVAQHTETQEMLVTYRSMDGTLWARPLSNFLSDVEVNGKKMKRFSPIIPIQAEGA